MRRWVLLVLIALTDMAAQSPPPVQLTVTADKAEYYLGEAIRLRLQYTSTQPGAFSADSATYDRIGRQNWVEEYRVEPAAGAEDPLHGLFAATGGMGGVSGGPVVLSDKPFVIERFLNEWIRFVQPGTYRLHVVSHRVSAGATRITVTSEPVTLEIHRAPAEWVREQISAATALLDGPLPRTPADSDARRNAARTLRFLNTSESAVELARRMDNGSGVRYWDLNDSSYHPQVLAVLEKRLVAPGEAIDVDYLTGMAEIAAMVARDGRLPQEKLDLYSARLIEALPGKQPAARAVCLVGLLDASNRIVPRPAWLGTLSTAVAADFRQLPAGPQETLLANHWRSIKRPAILPVLREICNKPAERTLLQDLALRRIYDLDAVEGRRLIVEEIRQRQHRTPFSTLAMLPDKALPELDEALAAGYENRAPDDELLILRYATGAVADRVRKVYEQRAATLLPRTYIGPVVYYLLKYDPKFAEEELRKSLATPGGPPVQYDIGFQFLRYGWWAMSPALEHLAIELLSSSSVPVKKGAAEILGKYGSADAKEPLWHTMEFFHSWWAGRESELNAQPYREGPELERTLAGALLQADGWVLTEAELGRLEQLCISRACRERVSSLAAQGKMPVRVSANSGEQFLVNVGPYAIASEEQLRRKLAQYPPDATFRLDRYGEVPEPVGKAIRESGHRVVE